MKLIVQIAFLALLVRFLGGWGAIATLAIFAALDR